MMEISKFEVISCMSNSEVFDCLTSMALQMQRLNNNIRWEFSKLGKVWCGIAIILIVIMTQNPAVWLFADFSLFNFFQQLIASKITLNDLKRDQIDVKA